MNYIRNALRYNWRRITGDLRKFPEVKGMNYRQYRKNFLR